MLGVLTAVLAYAKKCNIRVLDLSLSSLMIGGDRDSEEAVYFKQADVQLISIL
jgi:hypothetical protein